MSIGLLIQLALENLVGIGLNLYVVLPSSSPFGSLVSTIPSFAVHVVLGFLILATSVFLLVRTWSWQGTPIRWWAVLVLISVIVAIQEGFAFTYTGNSAFSFGMEAGFIGAVLATVAVLYEVVRRFPSAAASTAAMASRT